MPLKYFQRTWKLLLVSLVFVNVTGCKKLVDVDDPATSTNAGNVYANDNTAAAVLTGMYISMSQNSLIVGGFTSLTLFSGLSADELTLYSGSSNTSLIAYYQNNLSPSVAGYESWNNIYPFIFTCNSAIEGLTKSNTLTPSVKQQLLGEAKFMRAFFYFYLVNLYGDVPLSLTSDFRTNSNLARSPKKIVFEQIITDLKDAHASLDANYLKSDAITISTERVRPTKWAAAALLARAYLYNGNLTADASNYINAEAQASLIINNSTTYTLTSLGDVFLKNSREGIWQLQPVNADWNTEEARVFNLKNSLALSDQNPVSLMNTLVNRFEVGDQRRQNWIDSIDFNGTVYYFPAKYKSANPGDPVTEYSMVLRVAEQYLIRAEARAQQNNIAGAQSDLNAIRNRAGLTNTTANDKTSLLAAILNERQVELFTEWGHRWLDLKRTGKVDAIMAAVTPQKANGAAWRPFQQLYPIPIYDLERDPNLTQTTGY